MFNTHKFAKKVTEWPKDGLKGFFKSPLTYISLAAIGGPRIVYEISPQSMEANNDLVATATGVGTALLIYSTLRHYRHPKFLENWYVSFKSKKWEREAWKEYDELIDGLRDSDIQDENYRRLLDEAEGVRGDFKKANKIISQIRNAVISHEALEKYEEKLARLAEKGEVSKLPEPVDDKYAMVPINPYGQLSRNQQLRVDFFFDDVKEILDDEEERRELFRRIKKSRWYSRLKNENDMPTYMFFDDIMIALRKGEIPTDEEISEFLGYE